MSMPLEINTHIMKPTIALFLHQPRCSVQCANGMLLAFSTHYNLKIFTWHPLEDNFFDDVDMIAIPGGIGDADSFDHLLAHNGQRVFGTISHMGTGPLRTVPALGGIRWQ